MKKKMIRKDKYESYFYSLLAYWLPQPPSLNTDLSPESPTVVAVVVTMTGRIDRTNVLPGKEKPRPLSPTSS